MKGPSLQKTTALSAALHLSFFVIVVLILHQSRSVIVPSPYVVSIINPSAGSRGFTESTSPPERISRPTPEKQAKPADNATAKDTAKAVDQDSLKRLEDRLSELKAKKNIARIARMRAVVSVRRSDNQAQAKQPAGGAPAQGTLFDAYYAKITDQIWQEWIYPDFGDKDLEAVVAVRIAKDGAITVQGVEKRSGNTMFDRSALRALAKASPVAAPPYEMEIGIRFYP